MGILKQRRIWAGICAIISLYLRAFAPEVDFNADKATDIILTIVQAISDLGMVLLPIWSYFRPKK